MSPIESKLSKAVHRATLALWRHCPKEQERDDMLRESAAIQAKDDDGAG